MGLISGRSLSMVVSMSTVAMLLIGAPAIAGEDPVLEVGSITRVTQLPDGTQADADLNWTGASISTDGRYVAWLTSATNLAPGARRAPEVHIGDLASRSVSVLPYPNHAYCCTAPAIDGPEPTIVFTANAELIRPARTGPDAFVYTLESEQLLRASTPLGTDVSPTAGSGLDLDISADGRFVSWAMAVSDSRIDKSAGFYILDMQTMTNTWVAQRGWIPIANPINVQDGGLSNNGRWFVFTTKTPGLVADDTNDALDVYVYELSTGDIERVSGDITDDPANDNFNFLVSGTPTISDDGNIVGIAGGWIHDRSTGTTTEIRPPHTSPPTRSTGTPWISSDGRYVAFTGDRSHFSWLRDLQTGATIRLAAGNGTSTEFVKVFGISGDGMHVLIGSNAAVSVPGDTNGVSDLLVYNIRTSEPPSVRFEDVPVSHTFYSDVEWMAEEGITRGCNPPVNSQYCPDGVVTRGQMAAFLTRALGLTDRLDDPFVDDDDSVFQADIERLAAAGITKGCNPPVNDRFCPDGKVTREQMAAFLVRALGYADNGDGDLFVDDDDSVFEGDIDRLGTAGVTKGCNPPTNTQYCPRGNVTRGQMAAFLHRALG